MLSARTIYGEIFDNDEAFGLFCSIAAGIRGVYACERLGGWRRMVTLHMPARRNALGGPVLAQPSHA
jgi:hypothetical protein